MPTWLLLSVALSVSAIAAFIDLRSGRIPNWLTLPAMLLGLFLHGVGHGAAGFGGSLIGVVVCAAAPGVVYKVSDGQGIGGGDLKLFAALGALLGPTQGLEAEFSAFALLGLYALFRLAFQGQLLRTLLGSLRVLGGLMFISLRREVTIDSRLRCELRMGPAIAVGVVTVLFIPAVTRWLPWLG
jgi:prepilin peptidase CpaA